MLQMKSMEGKQKTVQMTLKNRRQSGRRLVLAPNPRRVTRACRQMVDHSQEIAFGRLVCEASRHVRTDREIIVVSSIIKSDARETA